MTDNECPICVETLHGLSSVGCTVPCGHVFHRKCFETWQIHSPSKRCPCCNGELSCFIDKIHIHLPEPTVQQEASAPSTPSTKPEPVINEEYETDEKSKVEPEPEPPKTDSESAEPQVRQEEHDDRSDKAQQKWDDAEVRELKMKRRAAISMEKAQRAMRLRNKACGTQANHGPESRNDLENNSQNPSSVSGLTTEGPSFFSAIENSRQEGTMSLSRSLQRPAVAKHPYRYMHGKKTAGSVQFSAPAVESQNRPVFLKAVKSNTSMNASFDELPDLADVIMRDIERSYHHY